MPEPKLVVLSGAGISAESGLQTFRDTGGLWEGYDINDVASIEGWHRDPDKVLSFYNMRRKQAADAEPNEAHHALAELESFLDVHIVTQNVDDLHERAGSSKVVHLHGELMKARSVKNPDVVTEIGSGAIKWGDLGSDGHQLRPDVVWFGEAVPAMETAINIVANADILLVVGTSLVVYPAASLIHYASDSIPKFLVDPFIPDVVDSESWDFFEEEAGSGLRKLANQLEQTYK